MSISDADWVVSSIEVSLHRLILARMKHRSEENQTLGRTAFSITAWTDGDSHSCPSRQDWLLTESLRRLGCTLYLFDLLTQSTARTPSKGNCDTFWYMPLPCPRALWEPATDADWSILYRQHLDIQKQHFKQKLTLRHLLHFRQAKLTGRPVDFADELADWCENVDDLSTLLWLALTVEGDGQSSVSV